jgi:hypothetical protein
LHKTWDLILSTIKKGRTKERKKERRKEGRKDKEK